MHLSHSLWSAAGCPLPLVYVLAASIHIHFNVYGQTTCVCADQKILRINTDLEAENLSDEMIYADTGMQRKQHKVIINMLDRQ